MTAGVEGSVAVDAVGDSDVVFVELSLTRSKRFLFFPVQDRKYGFEKFDLHSNPFQILGGLKSFDLNLL